MDLLTDKHEKLVLEDCYEKSLEESARRKRIRTQSMQPQLNIKEEEEDQITLEDMNIEDSIENIVNALEDVQVSSMDLMDVNNEDNEYVQEILKTIIINVPTVLSNLKEVFAKHNKTVLLARVNKIIDTQLMQ